MPSLDNAATQTPTPADPKSTAPNVEKQPQVQQQGLVYPNFEVIACVGERAITYDKMTKILGWETEPEFTSRMVAENPKIKESAAKFSDKLLASKGVEVICEDADGHKVVCWNNAHNRPFSLGWAMRFRQEFLSGTWRVNGESFIIGDRGNVLSGQKRGVGFILAVQEWRKHPEKYAAVWPTEPVYETVVCRGVKEDSKTIATLDNCQPRSDMDTIYTSEVYSGLSPAGKKECSRMLAKATEFIWARTGESTRGDGETVYRTPSEAAAFRERHPRLLKAVKHLYEENQERVISGLKLSPGMCAAVCYLQGCGTSDGDAYRRNDPPVEKGLKWDLLAKAWEFWSLIANAGDEGGGGSKEHEAVKTALGMLIDEDTGTGGRLTEKLAILARAWELFAAGKSFRSKDLELEYVERHGATHISPDQPQTFGGIDLGPAKVAEEKEEEVQEPTIEERRKAVAQEALKTVEAETPAQEKARREAVLAKAEKDKAEAKAKLLQNRQSRAQEGKPNGKPTVKIKGVTAKK